MPKLPLHLHRVCIRLEKGDYEYLRAFGEDNTVGVNCLIRSIVHDSVLKLKEIPEEQHSDFLSSIGVKQGRKNRAIDIDLFSED
jgi:hypothetical protein